MKRSELTGKTFGELLVIGFSEVSRNGHSRWHVVCSCGTEKTVLGTHLISGNTVHCGCQKKPHRNWKGVGQVPMTYFSSVRRGANGGKGRKPLDFEITIEDLSNVFENQKGLCAYSKMKIDFKSGTASLDRIDSSRGYFKDNIQWLHKDINMMKRHYSEDYFLELCTRIVLNEKSCEIVDLT